MSTLLAAKDASIPQLRQDAAATHSWTAEKKGAAQPREGRRLEASEVADRPRQLQWRSRDVNARLLWANRGLDTMHPSPHGHALIAAATARFVTRWGYARYGRYFHYVRYVRDVHCTVNRWRVERRAECHVDRECFT